LITGTGNVALFALLFAKAADAHVVVTSSSANKANRARRLGASNIVNYRNDAAWGESASTRAGPFDRVVNAAGTGALDQSIAALAPGGEITLIGLFDAARSVPDFLGLMTKGGTIRGTSVGSALAFADMAAFIDYYHLRPPIAKTFPMSEAKAAYELAGSGKAFGKVVIEVNPNPHSLRRKKLP
jgi:NADPH:quinone reductase-like Zn-dependent oxidoreductase